MIEDKDENRGFLKKLELKGFKSIKSATINFDSINILLGANGAGKTNLISLFTFLKHLASGKLKSYVEKNGFANTFFHFGPKTTDKIVIDIEVGENGYHVEFTHGATNDNLVFEKEYCTFSGSPRNYKIVGMLGESGLRPEGDAESDYVRKYTREYLEQSRVYHFHDTSSTAAFKQAQDINNNSYLAANAANLGSFLYRLKNEFPESYYEIVRNIQTVAPFFHDFYLVPQGKVGKENILLRWQHTEHDAPFSANQLSDGTARFICMTTLFLQPYHLRPSTIILDEPELGLHPAALEVLAEMMKMVGHPINSKKKIYDKRKSQIICSTQSSTFANLFEPEDFIIVDQNDGVSEFTRPKKKSLKVWLEEYSMGDLWLKNVLGGRPNW